MCERARWAIRHPAGMFSYKKPDLRQHQVEVHHPSINSQSHADRHDDTVLRIPHDFQWTLQTFWWMNCSLFKKYVTDLIKQDRIPEPRRLIPLATMMCVAAHSNTNMLKHRCGFHQRETFSVAVAGRILLQHDSHLILRQDPAPSDDSLSNSICRKNTLAALNWRILENVSFTHWHL